MKKELLSIYFGEVSEHLLRDQEPSEYLKQFSSAEIFSLYPFAFLEKLKSTEQSKTHHPEGSVWKHTLLVVDEAAKVRDQSNNQEVFMWSALLHDIGKANTTKRQKNKITSYNHDKEGEKLCIEFLECFIQNQEFILAVAAMVRYHMHMLYLLNGLPYADLQGLLNEVDIEDLALLSFCDRMGRIGARQPEEEEKYHRYLRILKKEALSL